MKPDFLKQSLISYQNVLIVSKFPKDKIWATQYFDIWLENFNPKEIIVQINKSHQVNKNSTVRSRKWLSGPVNQITQNIFDQLCFYISQATLAQ